MNVRNILQQQHSMLYRLCLSIAILMCSSFWASAQLTLSADCSSGTADVSGVTASNQPASATLTWHNATPASNANKINTVTALAPGTYYAAFYDATDDCYAPEEVTVTIVAAFCVENVCPATTVDLTTAISSTNTPTGTVVTYHTSLPASNANQVADATSVGAGTYFVAFYDATDDCFSGEGGAVSEVIVEIKNCDTDGDGHPDVTDPFPNTPTAVNDNGTIPFGSTANIDILSNDDFLDNNDANNLGTTTLSDAGTGTAGGAITFDTNTGEVGYTPLVSEAGMTVTIDYQVCNDASGSLVCDQATVSVTVPTDTDGDGVPNAQDLDDDNDGIPDITENATASNGGDTDGDGIPDALDLDSDNDGINDVIEAGGTDANNDGFADGTVGTTPTTNGIPSSAGTGLVPVNTDGVGAPDFQDLDSDDDGISDLIESGQDPAVVDTDDNGVVDAGPDADQDGIQDVVDGTPTYGDSGSSAPLDDDNDNIPNFQDLDSDDPTNTIGNGDDDINDSGNAPLDGDNDGQVDPTADADNDGIDDSIDDDIPVFGGLGEKDTDGDGVPDAEDLDDDNDGISDTVENATASNGGDTDGDGIPDALDLDSDNDGINDVIEAGGTDANNDGFADGTVGTTPTTNGIPSSAGTGLVPVNTDGVGAPDFQDLDSDDDGISDLIESGQDPSVVDTDDNGVVDTGPDADQDGIQDVVDGTPTYGDSGSSAPLDDDNDNIPNFQDLDSDDPTNTIGNGDDDINDSGNAPLDGDNDGQVDPTADADNDGIDDSIDDDIPVFGGLGVPDTDGDGIPNSEDLDDDNDGIPDITENATASNGGDTDGDGIPDALDLDSDNDGINDVIEAGGTDGNNDGFADGTVGTTPTTNGIPSSAGTGLVPVNTDGVGAPDFQDLDSDDDGISDLIESGQDPSVVDTDDNGVVDAGPDADQDGIQDAVDGTPTYGDSGSSAPQDSDSDNIPDFQDLDSDDPTNTIGNGDDDIDDSGNAPLDGDNDGQVDPTADVDNDGIDDSIDDDIPVFGGLGVPDTDGDGIPNSEDLDDDNDGIPDITENATASNGGDTDGDGIPDALDLDSDNDGINDVIEAGGTDANNDGFADGAIGTTPTTNGIPSSAGTGLVPVNTDGVGAPDFQDLDSDDDGISDLIESGQDPAVVDTDDNGVVDAGPDADQDGIQDVVDGTPTYGDSGSSAPQDSDSDNIPDFQDLDSDDPTNTIGNGDDDIDDSGNAPLDGDNDGQVDPTADVDNDGIDDSIDDDIPVFGGLGVPDTDGDGIPNSEDLDDDNDGIPDITENATASNGGDTDGDGIPDALDLDSDNDGINDVIEAGGTDGNNDGFADGTVGTTPTTNGIPSSAGTGLVPVNTDGVGAPDFQDLDSDDDGISDLIESGQDPSVVDTDDNGVVDAGPDADQDGIQDAVDGTPTYGDSGSSAPQDSDSDNIPDFQDLDSDDPTNTIGDGDDDIDDSGNAPLDSDNDGQVDPTADVDNDGIDDSIDDDIPVFGGLGVPDTDGDGIPNSEDLDDDNDGIPDITENATASNGGDTDGDGIPDALDLDSDNDGINDVIEAGGTDGNNDGFADGTVGTTPTTNGIPSSAGTGLVPVNTDGVGAPDFQDLDSDDDGVADIIESGNSALIDANGDDMVDGTDLDQDGILGTADGSPTYGDVNDPTSQNTDNDGFFDFQDSDDDGDGIDTEDEDTDGNGDLSNDDTDGDGTPDYLDPNTFIRVATKVFLQGAYNQFTGLMRDDLRKSGYLPTTEPYSELNYPHVGGGGGETVNASIFNTIGANAIVDWVILELRDQLTPSTVLATRAALVQRDGDIVDTDGTSPVVFLNRAIDNYYIAVKHRNHLGTMIDLPISLNQDVTVIDFTSVSQDNYKLTVAGSSNFPQKEFTNNSTVKALWAGNVDFNDRVIFQGSPVDQDGIFFGVLLDPGNTGLAANYIQEGYNRGDVNMDGTAIFQGSPNDTDIIFFNVVGHPENTNFLANFIIIQQIP